MAFDYHFSEEDDWAEWEYFNKVNDRFGEIEKLKGEMAKVAVLMWNAVGIPKERNCWCGNCCR
jgi:hypothetical protein